MVTKIPILEIEFNPAIFTGTMEESIKDYGQLVPLSVYLNESGRYEVIDGRRRLSVLMKLHLL